MARRRRQAPRDVGDRVRMERDGGAEHDHQAIPVQAAERAHRLMEHALERRDVPLRPLVTRRVAAADLGEEEEPFVLGARPTAAEEAIEIVCAREALEREIGETRQADARRCLGMQSVEVRLLAHARTVGDERAVHVAAARIDERNRAAPRRTRRRQRRAHGLGQRVHVVGLVAGHEDLERVRGRAAAVHPSVGDRSGRVGGDRRGVAGRAGDADDDTPVVELDPPRRGADDGGDRRRARRVGSQDVGGGRGAAPARIGVGEPAADLIEHLARRGGELQQHVDGRPAVLDRRRRRPGCDALRRDRGVARPRR